MNWDWERFWSQVDRLVHNLFLMASGIMVFFAFMYFADTNTNPISFISNTMALATYKTEAIAHINDNVSIKISDFCGAMPFEKQAECVVYQVLPFYNYSMHNDTIRNPDEYVEKGGVCRDSTVLYHTIFSRMGWYIIYDFNIPNHVFLTVTKSEGSKTMRCVIDGLMYNCETYNN